jgi:peptide/nickel transport system ATP-binding protein/oligopeptide transport system ATP-binding protein
VPAHLRDKQRIVLSGEIPSALNPPSGCRFHTRCPRATAKCSAAEPAWRELRPGRFVACHFAEDMMAAWPAAAAVPAD